MKSLLDWLNGKKVIITALVWGTLATLANGVTFPGWVQTVLNVLVAAGLIGAQVTAVRAGQLAALSSSALGANRTESVVKRARAFFPLLLIGLLLAGLAVGCAPATPATAIPGGGLQGLATFDPTSGHLTKFQYSSNADIDIDQCTFDPATNTFILKGVKKNASTLGGQQADAYKQGYVPAYTTYSNNVTTGYLGTLNLVGKLVPAFFGANGVATPLADIIAGGGVATSGTTPAPASGDNTIQAQERAYLVQRATACPVLAAEGTTATVVALLGELPGSVIDILTPEVEKLFPSALPTPASQPAKELRVVGNRQPQTAYVLTRINAAKVKAKGK